MLELRPTQSPQKKLTWIQLEPTPSDKKSEKKEKEENRKRIVQTESGEKVKTPKPDSFLGWQNQVVDRETVNKNKTVIIGRTSKSAPPKSKSKPQTEPRSLSKLGIPMLPTKNFKESDQPEWATPGVRPEDFIKGMKESDRTALNTSEYVFYTYFQRIRDRLDRAWVPILREKLTTYYNSGRQLASDMDHTTKVMVILNNKGEVIRVVMVSESGTRDLDDAAIGAFNKAGPFPNPPKGMIDINGEVKIPWDFVLKT